MTSRMYAGFLLNVLSAALPGEIVEVRREGKIKARLAGRSEPAVLAVSVHLGDRRYDLERAEFGRPLTATIRHQSGGVVHVVASASRSTSGRVRWPRNCPRWPPRTPAAAEILARLTTL